MKVQGKVLQVLLLILSAGSANANTSRCEAPMVEQTIDGGFTWTQGCVKHREFKQSCSSESARCPSGRCENIWGQRPRAVLVEEKTQGPLGCPGREPLDLPDSLEQILPSASLDEPSPLSQETELSEDLVSELLQPVDAGKCEEVVSNY